LLPDSLLARIKSSRGPGRNVKCFRLLSSNNLVTRSANTGYEEIESNGQDAVVSCPLNQVVSAGDSGDPMVADLYSAASELVDATGRFFERMSQPGFTQTADFDQKLDKLLADYNQFVGILESEIESRKKSPSAEGDTAQQIQEDLLRLYVALDHDRELLMGAFGLVREQLLVLNNPTEKESLSFPQQK
jgi:hypothetical protein